mmetsp:Transcript_4266/g.19221  ORF Transcript_4266/g.19221 Transcript_4266/m.19221 type:complete len:212 (-) Transcript_4266:2616-3251(-)
MLRQTRGSMLAIVLTADAGVDGLALRIGPSLRRRGLLGRRRERLPLPSLRADDGGVCPGVGVRLEPRPEQSLENYSARALLRPRHAARGAASLRARRAPRGARTLAHRLQRAFPQTLETFVRLGRQTNPFGTRVVQVHSSPGALVAGFGAKESNSALNVPGVAHRRRGHQRDAQVHHAERRARQDPGVGDLVPDNLIRKVPPHRVGDEIGG